MSKLTHLYLIGLNWAEYITLIKYFSQADQVEIVHYSKKKANIYFLHCGCYYILLINSNYLDFSHFSASFYVIK